MSWHMRGKIKNLALRVFSPLPSPEMEANKFFESPLQHLFFDQIKEIVQFIIDEAQKSREFGLYIKPQHLEKEELFFLSAINGIGGISQMRQSVPFEIAQRVISELMSNFFDAEKNFYFEQSKRQREPVHNKYSCHLECVRNRLLQEIYYIPNEKFYTA